MWLALIAYVIILVAFFRLVAVGKNKKKAFNLAAISLVLVHSVILVSLGLNDSAASLKKVSFEVWACDKQIQVADNPPTGRLFREGGYFTDRTLNVNNDQENLRLGTELKSAGLTYSESSVTVPISNSFELKVAGDNSLSWLRDSLKYPASSNQPSLVLENNKLLCPTDDLGTWNIFLARVDNKMKTYTWQKVELAELAATLAHGSDGDDLPDCLIMDYDQVKETPEYRCADILKNDVKRCPDEDKTKCLYKEVKT